MMELSIERTTSYVVAQNEGTRISGCVVIASQEIKAKPLNGTPLQCLNGSLFIPDQSQLFPFLVDIDWQQLFSDDNYFFHPETGLVQLTIPVKWGNYLQLQTRSIANIISPINVKPVPILIKDFRVEIKEEDWIKEMQQKELQLQKEQLSFDMTKIMKGNPKELAKYLKFMELNPDKALAYALPLDFMGTTRGRQWAAFNFPRNNWWSKLYNSTFGKLLQRNDNSNNDSVPKSNNNVHSFRGKPTIKWVGILFIIVMLTGIVRSFFRTPAKLVYKEKPVELQGRPTLSETMVENVLENLQFLIFFGLIVIVCVTVVIRNRNKRRKAMANIEDVNSQYNWSSVAENENQGPIFSIGGNINLFKKLGLVLIFGSAFAYLYNDLISEGMFGLKVVIGIIILRVLFKYLKTDANLLSNKTNAK